MPFTVRPYRRFPICCPVTYQTGLFEGHGTLWNLSLTGWRFSGNLPLRIGGSVFADGESAELPAGLVVPLPRSAVGVAEAKEIGPMNN